MTTMLPASTRQLSTLGPPSAPSSSSSPSWSLKAADSCLDSNGQRSLRVLTAMITLSRVAWQLSLCKSVRRHRKGSHDYQRPTWSLTSIASQDPTDPSIGSIRISRACRDSSLALGWMGRHSNHIAPWDCCFCTLVLAGYWPETCSVCCTLFIVRRTSILTFCKIHSNRRAEERQKQGPR